MHLALGAPADVMAVATSSGSERMRTTSAVSTATSVPAPMAMPTSACASAGASLTPSPTIATLRPCCCSSVTFAALSAGSTSAMTSSLESRQIKSARLRGVHDGLRQRVFAVALGGGDEAQRLMFVDAVGGGDGDHLGLAARQRAGLVEHDGIEGGACSSAIACLNRMPRWAQGRAPP
jgi:hypothetical protein